MKKLRIYLDTSVFGGCFDEEFARASRKLFDEVKTSGHTVIVSETTIAELVDAPAAVQEIFKNIPAGQMERVEPSLDVIALRNAYIKAGIVTKKCIDDATHVAAATIAGADLIISWNFRHIVHFEKISGYNRVNRTRGYQDLGIFSPKEVIHEEV